MVPMTNEDYPKTSCADLLQQFELVYPHFGDLVRA